VRAMAAAPTSAASRSSQAAAARESARPLPTRCVCGAPTTKLVDAVLVQ
jgi:hypothetical protein